MASFAPRFFYPNAPMNRAVVLAVLALAAVGVASVYSALSYWAQVRMDSGMQEFGKHLFHTVLGLAMMVGVSFVDYRKWERLSLLLLVVSLVLLVLVQFVGSVIGGAQRWLEFGGLTFQPSDMARVALVLHTAVLLAKKQAYIDDFQRGFLPLFFWAAVTGVLIGIDNLSTASLLMVVIGAMWIVGRVRVLHLAGLAGVGLALAVLLLLTSPERAQRIEAHLGVSIFSHTNKEEVFDNQAERYQIEQAQIAIANGGLLGLGPGKSIQRNFLPASQNDFIYAIIAEEYGFVGALVVLGLFVFVLFQGFLRIARHAPCPFGLFLAAGLTTMVTLYGFINAGVATGLLPVTGLAMPFVSMGGTSMAVTGGMIGILLNISRQVHAETAPAAGSSPALRARRGAA